MEQHFCKVGRITPSEYLKINLFALEQEYHRFIDEAYSLTHLDNSISDFLYFEASKLRKKILILRKFI